MKTSCFAPALGALLLGCLAFADVRADEAIDFSRDIRPILSNACFKCHGPDDGQRQAELRLDTPEGAFADLGGHAAFKPGSAAESEALRRILSSDPDEKMPPPDSGKMV